jgi:PPK2 family polyphosphate:nucleotide phosphotransferase
MALEQLDKYIAKLKIKPGKKVSLDKMDTDFDRKMVTKEEGENLLKEGIEKLAEIQDKLYAHNQYRVLIVLQAMDAAGKDGAIKHVLSGLNPQGVKVNSFKTPTSNELDHDYFWRHYLVLPPRGEIGIFNRSHYENVLVTRVHPEYILNENLPGINTIKDITPAFWKKRLKQINRFEKNLAENGTVIIKLFLHVSKEEQKKRFLERIEDPTKNWKFSIGDINERARWDDYMNAYEEVLTETSQSYAPWYVVPADDKWFARLSIAAIIYNEFEKLQMSYPVSTPKQLLDLKKAKELLLNEKETVLKSKKIKNPS